MTYGSSGARSAFGRSTPSARVEQITSLQDIAAEIGSQALGAESFSALVLQPWIDLARLALMAEQGELVASGEHTLDDATLVRVEELLGERPAHYFRDLMHCARVLRVLTRQGDLWQVVSHDSELLGATRRETFPAMCAVWLKEPPPIRDQTLTAAHNIQLRLEFLRLLHLLEPEYWYPHRVLGVLVRAAASRQSVPLSGFDEADCRQLAERILMPLGAVLLNRDQTHFSLQDGLHIPALPGVSDLSREERARAFRTTIRENIADSNRWRRVATGLIRCIETRRTRDASPTSVRCLDTEGRHLETDPRLPFKDCLFVARLGKLTPPSSHSGTQQANGQFVFRLDSDLIRQQVQQGLPVESIARFLAERCEEDSYRRFCNLLQQTVPGAKLQ